MISQIISPSSPSYVVNIDRLIISFQTNSKTFFSQNLKSSNHFFHLVSPNNEFNKDYKQSYIILDPKTRDHLFYLDIENRFHPNYNRIRVVNKTLYKFNFQTLLDLLITDYKLTNPVIRYIDICIDTTEPLLERFSKNLNKGLLKPLNKSYSFYYYGNELERINSGTIDETKYIKKKTQKYLSCERVMRIENKSKEIQDHNFSKSYILDKLKTNGLDVSRRIERMELRLSSKVFENRNPVYINKKTGLEISKTKYKTLMNENNDHEIKDIWDNTPTKDYKFNYSEKIKTTFNYPEIEKLGNSDYLISIFNQYSVFNHSKIISLPKKPIQTIPRVEIKNIVKRSISNYTQTEIEMYLEEQEIKYKILK